MLENYKIKLAEAFSQVKRWKGLIYPSANDAYQNPLWESCGSNEERAKAVQKAAGISYNLAMLVLSVADAVKDKGAANNEDVHLGSLVNPNGACSLPMHQLNSLMLGGGLPAVVEKDKLLPEMKKAATRINLYS